MQVLVLVEQDSVLICRHSAWQPTQWSVTLSEGPLHYIYIEFQCKFVEEFEKTLVAIFSDLSPLQQLFSLFLWYLPKQENQRRNSRTFSQIFTFLLQSIATFHEFAETNRKVSKQDSDASKRRKRSDHLGSFSVSSKNHLF
jgi:hypothetical protein